LLGDDFSAAGVWPIVFCAQAEDAVLLRELQNRLIAGFCQIQERM
jgi:hypothetical protein